MDVTHWAHQLLAGARTAYEQPRFPALSNDEPDGVALVEVPAGDGDRCELLVQDVFGTVDLVFRRRAIASHHHEVLTTNPDGILGSGGALSYVATISTRQSLEYWVDGADLRRVLSADDGVDQSARLLVRRAIYLHALDSLSALFRSGKSLSQVTPGNLRLCIVRGSVPVCLVGWFGKTHNAKRQDLQQNLKEVALALSFADGVGEELMGATVAPTANDLGRALDAAQALYDAARAHEVLFMKNALLRARQLAEQHPDWR